MPVIKFNKTVDFLFAVWYNKNIKFWSNVLKKTVFYTATITLAVAIAVIFAVYFIIAAVSPITVAKFWDNTGAYALSVKYYERQYEKTDDDSDLAELCLKLNEYEDSVKAATYCEILTGKEGYSEFCQKIDAEKKYSYKTYDYYYGKYAVAEYLKNGMASAILVAEASQYNGYTEYNPYYVLLNDGKLNLSDGDKDLLISAAEDFVSSLDKTDEEKAAIKKSMGIA